MMGTSSMRLSIAVLTICILATFASQAFAQRSVPVTVMNDSGSPVPVTSADEKVFFTAYADCSDCNIMVVPAGKKAIITDIVYVINPNTIFHITNNGQQILKLWNHGVDETTTFSMHFNSGLVAVAGVISQEGHASGTTLTGYFIPEQN